MKQLGIWCLIILGMLLAVPMVMVFGGGFYDASLLANVQTMNTDGEDIESKEDEKELISALAKMVSADEQPDQNSGAEGEKKPHRLDQNPWREGE